MTKTALQLKTEIRNQLYPSGEAENLVAAHDQIFQEAFAEIAKWVDGERAKNVDVIIFPSTYYKCGMTILATPPRGIIKRLYTIANDEFCDPVFYQQKEYPEPEEWARNRLFPTTSNAPVTALGVRAADASTDFYPNASTQRYPRCRAGIWAIYDGRIYIAPWLQSNESVVIEWAGIKSLWADADLVNPDQDYKKCVKLYLQYAHERDYGDRQAAQSYRMDFDQAVADLMWEDRERTKKRTNQPTYDQRSRTSAELADDVSTIEPMQNTPQILDADGVIDLNSEITLLSKIGGGPYNITLPDGDDLHVSTTSGTKQVYIPKANENQTATFIVTGNFTGFSSITFNNTGYSAILRWIKDDAGGSWVMTGGNALAN